MGPVQDLLVGKDIATWISSYDIRPAQLFEGVDQRLAIYITTKSNEETRAVHSSRYHRWHEVLRNALLLSVEYVRTETFPVNCSVPKVATSREERLLEKLVDNTILKANLLTTLPVRSTIYFHNAPRYWVRAMDFAPYFWNERDGEQISTQVKSLNLPTEISASATVAALNSSLFYWWFLILSDCRHLNLREIANFPLGLERMHEARKARLGELTNRLMANFHQHKTRKKIRHKSTGAVIYDEFNQKPSKPIVDEIDRVLAEHYGFTDEELDFIVNYDIKYRMGR